MDGENLKEKNQLIVPPLSVVSGNEIPTHNNSEASSSTSPMHSSIPLQLNIADHPVLVKQPPIDRLVEQPSNDLPVELPIDLPADPTLVDPPAVQLVATSDAVETPSNGITSVISELKPVARPTSLSNCFILN